MLNPHPPLAGFPIVLCTLTLAAELLSFFWKKEECRKFAAVTLRVLCVVAPLTYYSGYWGAEYASKSFSVSEDVIASHQAVAKFFLMTLIPALLFSILERQQSDTPSKWLRPTYLLCVLLMFGVCVLTSTRGGALVFSHGAGVELETM